MAAGTALAVYLLGLGLAFGWRSLVQWRHTGDTGLRLDAGPAGTLRWWAKLLFLAALPLGLAGPVAGLAGMRPVGVLDRPAIRIAGLVIAVAGVGATLRYAPSRSPTSPTLPAPPTPGTPPESAVSCPASAAAPPRRPSAGGLGRAGDGPADPPPVTPGGGSRDSRYGGPLLRSPSWMWRW